MVGLLLLDSGADGASVGVRTQFHYNGQAGVQKRTIGVGRHRGYAAGRWRQVFVVHGVDHANNKGFVTSS